MATRKPLVVISGNIQELPTADTLDVSSTSNKGTAPLDFGAGKSDTSVIITGQSSILSSNVVNAFIIPSTTAEHSVEEHLAEELIVMAGNIVAGIGFTIYGKTGNVALRGKYNIGWSWV